MTADNPSRLVPKLRFPEFSDVGDWRLKPLGDIAESISEKVGANNSVPMSVTAGVGLLSQEEKFGRTIAGNSYTNYIRLQTNDFAYNKSATKDFPQGYIARYTGTKDAAVPNSIFACFRPDAAAVVPEFLDHLFHGNYHGRWLRKYITVGARAHGALSVSDDDLMSMPVPLPPDAVSRSEQQKIADCLGSLDDLIAAEGRKLGALRQHKQGLMQGLFPREGERVPRLRFLEFRDTGKWAIRELAEFITERNQYPEERVTLYSLTIEDGVTPKTERYERSFLVNDEVGAYKLVLPNDFAFNPMNLRFGAIGRHSGAENVAVSKYYNIFSCDSTVDSRFCVFYFKSDRMVTLYDNIATGSLIEKRRVHFAKFLELNVRFPQLSEQQRIADCLSSLDTRIAGQSQRIDTLKQHKQGLLQQLFPSLAGDEQ